MNSLRSSIGAAIIFLIGVVFFVGKYNLYNDIPHLDKVFHVMGGAIAAWFFLSFYKKDFIATDRWAKVRFALAIVGAATLVGVLWEFAEHLSSLYGSPLLQHYFYGGDLGDTLGDIFADIIGAVLVAISL